MTEKQEAALRLAREALEASKRTHHYCEDTWYSCPKHEDGCANESEGDECNCGADEANAQLDKAITAIDEALAEQPAQQQEPVAFPPVQFEKVAEGVEVGYDFLGGVDIRLGGEFVYVHINYDYRYTHNAARKALADQIVGLITTQPASKPWVGLSNDEIYGMYNEPRSDAEMVEFARALETKLREKNA